MKYMKNYIFCQKILKISDVNRSGGHLLLVECGEPGHQFAISLRGDAELNRHPHRKEVVIKYIEEFKRKNPTEIPQVLFNEKWDLSIVK